jgi:hypothetical protein
MTNIEVPPKPERDVIREVDWLAVAPWLLVLRAVGATIGWPLVIGVIGYALLGWSAQLFDFQVSPLRVDFALTDPDLLAENPSNAFGSDVESTWFRSVGWPMLRHFIWMMLGVVIAQHAARRLGDRPRLSLLKSLRRALRYGPRVLGAIALLAIPAGCYAIVLAVGGVIVNAVDSPMFVNTLSSIGGVFAGLPLAVLIGVIVYGAPLIVASVVVDDADPFDALSRTAAYVFQKPGSLAACIFSGWFSFLVSSLVIDWLLTTSVAVTNAFTDGVPVALRYVLHGFYPAYFYCAGVATYLVMRRQVDGQPLDEISHAGGEA